MEDDEIELTPEQRLGTLIIQAASGEYTTGVSRRAWETYGSKVNFEAMQTIFDEYLKTSQTTTNNRGHSMNLDEAEKKAHSQLNSLANQYNLSFMHNPGGGEFYNTELGRCQVYLQNYVEDLAKVEAWLKENYKIEWPGDHR